MQANDTGPFAVPEMTPNGVTNLLVQVLDCVCLGKYRDPQRTRSQAALRCILYNKNEFVHGYYRFLPKNIADMIAQRQSSCPNRLATDRRPSPLTRHSKA
jgi:hypothetical protein